MNADGSEGWEMVGVVPIWNDQMPNKGYRFFWKRLSDEVEDK